jgi:tRNA threonylcarbamoyl adenosine modification protein YeaZ
MKVLAFDTCFGACSAALVEVQDGCTETLASMNQPMNRGHAEALIPMIDTTLARGKTALDAVDRFAVTIGPGTFTGVRVGIAAARAFALATSKPVIAVGTLEAVAMTAVMAESTIADGAIAVVIDARRDQFYLQTFNYAGSSLSPTMADPVVCCAEDVYARIPVGQVTVVGSGGPLLDWPGPVLPDIVLIDGQPDAAAVGHLAVFRQPASLPVTPFYLRPPDAKPQTGFALERQSL